MYKFFYAISPKRYRQWVENHIEYADFKISPIKLVGFLISFGLVLSFAFSLSLFALNYVTISSFGIAWILGFFVFEIVLHGIIVLIADNRAKFVEEILPDALQIISSNMRSGLTADKAILTSARPEFGPLEKELKRVAKETLSGKPLEESLREITKKIKSKILGRTIDLLVEGMMKGGSLTNLLDSIADDIRQITVLKKEIKSYVIMYGIFIFFAVSIGGPLLYSISTFLVQTITKLSGQIQFENAPTSASVPFLRFKFTPQISSEFLFQYAVIAITMTGMFGSILIGLIQEGSEKAGLRYMPILIPIGLGIFFAVRILLSSFFKTLIV